MTSTPVIALDHVARTYQVTEDIVVHALRGITLQIAPGDYVAVMGSSGSGKSTLMHILGCLDAPTSGRYRLDGTDVRDIPEDDLADLRNRKIGFIFQAFNLVPRTSALANVELPLTYAGVPRAVRRARAAAALRAVGMGDRMHHLPSELSGGQQQRVAVARAIVTNPPLILADEPTGNLDSHSTSEVLDVFERLHATGRTIVMITHEEDVAARAQRTIRLGDGRIIAQSAQMLGGNSPRLLAPQEDDRRERPRDPPDRARRRGGQQAAFRPDDPRHDDRRVRRDHPRRGRQRVPERGRVADQLARVERPARAGRGSAATCSSRSGTPTRSPTSSTPRTCCASRRS